MLRLQQYILVVSLNRAGGQEGAVYVNIHKITYFDIMTPPVSMMSNYLILLLSLN